MAELRVFTPKLAAPIHPAAELFPLMSPDELREPANDISSGKPAMGD